MFESWFKLWVGVIIFICDLNGVILSFEFGIFYCIIRFKCDGNIVVFCFNNIVWICYIYIVFFYNSWSFIWIIFLNFYVVIIIVGGNIYVDYFEVEVEKSYWDDVVLWNINVLFILGFVFVCFWIVGILKWFC